MHARRIQSVLVEGGTRVLQALIDSGSWEEIRRFRSPKVLGDGVPAPSFRGVPTFQEKLMEDELEIYWRR